MRRSFGVIAITLLLAGPSLGAGSVGTRECIIYASFKKEYQSPASVFVGRVLAVDYIPGRECCHILSGHATLEVVRSWKGGDPPKQLRIGAVGPIFKVGTEYVVFGFGSPLVADGCNSTRPTKDSRNTLKWLASKPSRRAG